jgi:hypothetical protein
VREGGKEGRKKRRKKEGAGSVVSVSGLLNMDRRKRKLYSGHWSSQGGQGSGCGGLGQDLAECHLFGRKSPKIPSSMVSGFGHQAQCGSWGELRPCV